MLEFENLTTSLDQGVITITISRENKLNALNIATIAELKRAVQSIYDDPQVKAAIITGAGSKAFVAGADISEIAKLAVGSAQEFAENGQQVFAMIENCPKPIVAAVNGFALGGGCELAMACHIRIALNTAKFGQPEVSLGLVPGYGGTQRLPALIGKARALELILTGDIISAQQALNFGLVNYLVDAPEELITLCKQVLNKIMCKAPLAVGMVIECVNAAYDPERDGYQIEASRFAQCCSTKDFIEGTAAFKEKRNPNFQGI
ncbi:MAG: enoyl-CoA hydratase [Cyclobacteriaceae bacterium]|nr:MAG: enoyl-CoA hydratase [Cyclobacteriaceae bacterium]